MLKSRLTWIDDDQLSIAACAQGERLLGCGSRRRGINGAQDPKWLSITIFSVARPIRPSPLIAMLVMTCPSVRVDVLSA